MKKVITALCTALVVVILAFTLTGCSTYGKIEKAFIKNGYEVKTDVSGFQEKLLETLNANSEEEAKAVCTIHLLVKYDELTGKIPVHNAFIFEFSSTDEMNKKIEESSTLKGLIKDAQNSDYVNGNCVLSPISANPQAMIEIFKNA